MLRLVTWKKCVYTWFINTNPHWYKHRWYSAPSPVYDASIAGSSLVARWTSILPGTSLGTRKLRYLRVSSRIFKRNFHSSAQNDDVGQHSEQSRKPSSQQQDFKESWKAYIVSLRVTGHWIHLGIICWFHFLTSYWYRYAKNYKAVNTYHQVLLPWKC